MKKIAFIISSLILASLAWLGFVREPLPPIPEICAEISEEVGLKFAIHTLDYTGIELSMNETKTGKGMYIQFKMANAWKTGRAGLVLNGIKESSGLKNGMSAKSYLNDAKRKEKGGKDFSDFMKDNKGKSLSAYAFNQTLVEGKAGQMFMRIAYEGPAMEMIQTLEIPRPVTLPAHISSRFIQKGIIQFQPGTVTLDGKIKGFYVPVVIR